MKKILVLTLVSAMFFSMPVMAKNIEPPKAVYLEDESNIGDPDATVAAVEEGKLIGEYMNNVVTGVWDMDTVVPVGQGGKVIIDGVTSNITFSIQKPEFGHVGSAKILAEKLGGKVLNVVDVKVPAPLTYGVANVNFYTPGVVAGQNVKVYKYVDYTTWNEFNVTEVRDDHVVADMTSGGIIAFIEVPAEVSAE